VENPQKAKKLCENATKAFSKFDSFFFFLLEIREFVTKFCRNSPLNFFKKKTQEPLHLSGALLGVN